MKTKLPLFLSLLLLIWILPSSAFACACCVEPGHYSIRTAKPKSYEIEELKKIKFNTAELYMTAAGDDFIKGINPLGESFTVNALLNGAVWSFNFKDNNQKTGKLDLTKPISMVEFMVDLPSKEKQTGETRVYKEWRFKYRLQNANGIFKNAFAPATDYFLVLQGYGNGCTSADDFTKYHLEITGKKADFTFFGNVGS